LLFKSKYLKAFVRVLSSLEKWFDFWESLALRSYSKLKERHKIKI
jgi:hypothetical protein